jgi:hypothetical protein
MVPPCLEEAEFALLLDPPPEGLGSLLPQAAMPSASTAADPAASHWLDLTSEHLIYFVALVRPQASNAQPCSLLPTRRWNVKSV